MTTDSEPLPAKAANEVITGSASACADYHELIQTELGKGRNAMAIWPDLVDHHGFSGAYQSVKRYVRKLRGAQGPEARAIVVTAPGEEGQVDYGEGPRVRDPATGNYRRTRLFVLTLGYSRKAVRLQVFHSSSRVWAELHEKAFARLGGTPRVILPDFVPGNKIEIMLVMCLSPMASTPLRAVAVDDGT